MSWRRYPWQRVGAAKIAAVSSTMAAKLKTIGLHHYITPFTLGLIFIASTLMWPHPVVYNKNTYIMLPAKPAAGDDWRKIDRAPATASLKIATEPSPNTAGRSEQKTRQQKAWMI